MPDAALQFSLAEYTERLTKTRVAMQAAGIETLIVTDPANMAWLSGYDGWSFYVHQAVIVTLHDDLRWWGRRMDAPGALRTVYMAEAQIHSNHDDFVQSTERTISRRYGVGQLAARSQIRS